MGETFKRRWSSIIRCPWLKAAFMIAVGGEQSKKIANNKIVDLQRKLQSRANT